MRVTRQSGRVFEAVAAIGLVVGMSATGSAQQLALEAAFPRQLARGQATTIHVAVQTRDVVQSAEVTPAPGVTVARVALAKAAEMSQGVAWWDIAVDVAADAGTGPRTFTVMTAAGRSMPVTITIPERAPSLTAAKAVAADPARTVAIELTAAAAVGERPAVWFTATCGGEPLVGVVRGRATGTAVQASLPLARAIVGSGAPRCDLQLRIADAAGVESNTVRTMFDLASLPRTPAPPPAAAGRASAEWTEILDGENRFTATFPGEPVVADTTWTTQFGAVLPARTYAASGALGRFVVTAVDYNPIERLETERSMSCPAGAETCQGIHDWGLGYWKNEIRGAVGFAARQFLQRDVVVTDAMSNFADLVAGQELVLTSRADGSRTYVSVYMHENRLLILEADVPRGGPPPTIFQQTVGWLDDKGNRIRYLFIYHNEPDVPRPPFRVR